LALAADGTTMSDCPKGTGGANRFTILVMQVSFPCPLDISEKCQYLSIAGFQQAIAQGAVRSAQSQGANVSQSQ